ncbi:DUF4863 family protein [Aromatoleum evansii]|uniref:DUF4863 family protein n=1 Tax=Aromatoleum evansii TaxID=59406 RepID=Q84HH9_AROEV|nr:DUF4863 family protein [Aromatoleum evansii]AAN39372.1 unknown [Aromatoleum evansii]NMG27617.1 DUF4863 family protein [Aromatoleum evansii]WRL46317.1 DUF4863 family protein [Aromatoleum evansii]
MTPDQFQALIAKVTDEIAGRPLDGQLADFLNERFPANGPEFQAIAKACSDAVAAGWMCEREHGGIRFGRVIKPTDAIHGFSVDVVEMQDVVGPQHAHPNGEIDMIMPLEGDAKFDGHGAGWFVYEAGSVHRPTVMGGRAYVLYLLPQGAIEFTKS